MSARAALKAAMVAGAGLAAALAWACGDPVHDTRVDSLGGEQGSAGPTPRPGQPCLACHGGDGPAGAELAIAGTIFQSAAPSSPPVVGATVTVFDATQVADGGAPHSATTNGAGNFYFRKSDWSPVYPLHDISVSFPGIASPTLMGTTVGRDGSCATCHFDPKGAASHGHVYLVFDPADFPGAMP